MTVVARAPHSESADANPQSGKTTSDDSNEPIDKCVDLAGAAGSDYLIFRTNAPRISLSPTFSIALAKASSALDRSLSSTLKSPFSS